MAVVGTLVNKRHIQYSLKVENSFIYHNLSGITLWSVYHKDFTKLVCDEQLRCIREPHSTNWWDSYMGEMHIQRPHSLKINPDHWSLSKVYLSRLNYVTEAVCYHTHTPQSVDSNQPWKSRSWRNTNSLLFKCTKWLLSFIWLKMTHNIN